MTIEKYIKEYIKEVNNRFKSGISREHSYRGELEILLKNLIKGFEVTNEPANVTDCGNPDYVITKNKVPVGYIEAKDIGKDLDSKQFKEQFTRYKKALDNLIITDYIKFQFFQNGELITEVSIAEIKNGAVRAISDNFDKFITMINNFCSYIGQTIKSSKRLAKMMAARARLLQNIIENAVTSDEKSSENTSLRGQYQSFKKILIHDLTPQAFSDIYAQTIAYGMFAARLNDRTLNDFSRYESAELIPKSNPFLKKLFSYIAGTDIDDRIVKTVDNLADVFRASNIKELLSDFGKDTQTNDPIIHFYETFLAEYDPKLRKSRGVWYTPQPVVNFIVRAVDDILKSDFDLSQGLADTTKTSIKLDSQTRDKRSTTGYKQFDKEVHKVQILDPATGTGTFLAQVIRHIYNTRFKSMQGAWSSYAKEHLIPRINGFEILMASYAMAHLKISLILQETGYEPKKDERLKIYLTNSLEEYHPDTGTIFANWISTEANEANEIKRDTPVMCVLGNPPYSGESANKGKWIMKLMEDYKKEPEGKVKLKERNPKWINDDYVKFIRYASSLIEKNKEGILAFINPHGFLDNPTFRGMRWHLLKTYDKIYTIDLHGNSKKKEVCPDGSKDENVFDIMQGVAITFFIKTGKKANNELAKVFHYDLYGKREFKYDFFNQNSLDSIKFVELINKAPNYFMVQKDFEAEKEYEKGFSVNELFPNNGVGLTTAHDDFVIKENQQELLNLYKDFQSSPRDVDFLHNKFNVKKKKGWDILKGYDNIKNEKDLSKYIYPIAYRPFDNRYIFYEDKLVWRTVRKVMQHFINGKNIGLVVPRQCVSDWRYIFITTLINDLNLTGTAGRFGSGTTFPLYLYPNNESEVFNLDKRTPNFNENIIENFSKKINLTFTNEKEDKENTFAPIDVLDYIYAVLHSPSYREKYNEFLKIDFPRVPYPKDKEIFWKLVKLGAEIRQIHLLESSKVQDYITQYPIDGDNRVEKIKFKEGKIYINNTQYFDNVPQIAWDFYIGGYQPVQKWLKDRKKRTLNFEDILHYQKIIVALTQTDKLMKEIDKIEFE